ncbi:unnamed protein product [Phaedon cochleariae]|uniref:Uncharacterized protein n=1 Tax=Phaedon cochleariae TaxID=80249 RepID=A0A9N9SM27_PHACE|nr:unnamed protein product [Phaedon cochleariae]
MEELKSENEILKKQMLNFSGKGAFLLWDMFKNDRFIMNGEWTQDEAAQVMYHCTFGTFKEDLGILGEMTNQGNWFTREDLGGSRNVRFSEEFFENISKKLGGSSGGRTIQQLTSSLSDLLDKLLQKLRNDGGLMEMGTTSWFLMEDTDEEKIQTPSNFEASARGKFFLGKKTPNSSTVHGVLIVVFSMCLTFCMLGELTRCYVCRSSGGRTIQQLTSSLSDLLDKLSQKLRDDGGLLEMGTTSWFLMEDTDEEKIQTPSNFVASARGKFF